MKTYNSYEVADLFDEMFKEVESNIFGRLKLDKETRDQTLSELDALEEIQRQAKAILDRDIYE